jgi:transposase
MIGLKSRIRAELLFTNYPLLHKTYKHTLEFRNIYEETSRELKEKIVNWIEKTNNTAANSLKYHLETILNFFIKRHTNAIAESFNSKIKLFSARGVADVKFFLFRMEKLLPLIEIYVTQFLKSIH